MCMQCQIQRISRADATPVHSNLLQRTKFVPILVGGSAEVPIDKIMTPWKGHVHAILDPVYLGARCDTQAFELAGKKLYFNEYRYIEQDRKSCRITLHIFNNAATSFNLLNSRQNPCFQSLDFGFNVLS